MVGRVKGDRRRGGPFFSPNPSRHGLAPHIEPSGVTPNRGSTIGRPRKLSDRQVKIILAWHVRYLMWRALRNTLKSQRELARELGVSQSTVSSIVRIGGQYKQVSPKARLRANRVRGRP